jgi:hypothetical protein
MDTPINIGGILWTRIAEVIGHFGTTGMPHSEEELGMNVAEILEELKAERLRIESAIDSLESLALGRRRRGRPPSWMTEARRRAQAPETKNKNSDTAERATGAAA